MKCGSISLLVMLSVVPVCASASEHVLPAGALVQCTVSEPKISSKTTAIGDPVLCQVGHAERYGRAVLPSHSFLVGRFEDYKDPGHFVGKGWMELKFDRMVIEPDTILPVDVRVVDVPGYNVDRQGRILGKGHAVRDTVMWSIPVLWPIDLLMLPARGPRPALKAETRMTVKLMDDLEIPEIEPQQPDSHGLMHRQSEVVPPPALTQDPEPDVVAMADDPSLNDQPVEPAAVPVPQQVVVYEEAPPPPTVVVYGGYYDYYAPPVPVVRSYVYGAYGAAPMRSYGYAGYYRSAPPPSMGYGYATTPGYAGYATRTANYTPRAAVSYGRGYAPGYAGGYARGGGAPSGGYGPGRR